MRGIPGRVQLVVSIALVVLATACGRADDGPATGAGPTAATPATTVVAPTTTVGSDDVEVLGTSLIAPATAVRPTAVAPETVLLVGDSSMVDLEPALEASFLAAGVGRVVYSAWPGFGLSQTQFGWQDRWRAVVAEETPSIIVVLLGGWDLGYLADHGPEAYQGLVDEALEVLMAGGARVEWLAMLPGGGSYLPEVNAVYAQLAEYPGAVDFYDAQGPLRSPDGTFLRTVPSLMGELLVRKPDHYHFCPDGAALVAADVHAHLTEVGWLPAAVPGWQTGAWRERPEIYDNPAGACDPVS